MSVDGKPISGVVYVLNLSKRSFLITTFLAATVRKMASTGIAIDRVSFDLSYTPSTSRSRLSFQTGRFGSLKIMPLHIRRRLRMR
jgi:hypothetical protein